MFNEKIWTYDSLSKAIDGMSFATVTYTDDELPYDNQWAFNSKKEIHIKDTSTTLTGMLRNRIYGLIVGDIVEVECEVFPISGVLPKIVLDSNAKLGLASTDGYTYPYNQWKLMSLKYVIQRDADHHSINVGTFTLDVAEFKMRNIRIRVLTQTSVFTQKMSTNFIPESGLEAFNPTNFPCVLRKDGNLVSLTIYLKQTNGTPFTANSTITVGRIPLQYRPISGLVFPIAGSPTETTGGGRGWIYDSGVVIVKPYVDMDDIAISITYISN